jgi:REP element-mobilizing transposase RayT
MPRQARLVFPGGLYHIIARGIERRRIFVDTRDYKEFQEGLSEYVPKTGCRCLAWVLMPNHFHLLIQAGKVGTAPLMRRLMTGYAGYFNRRHRRAGHLFQNRYKSILCEENPYLLELVRYIHLNPLRAGIVSSLELLEAYPWSGHRALLGIAPPLFQEVDDVINRFGGSADQALAQYRRFMADGASMGRRPELVGGGLLRSLGQRPGQWGGAGRHDRQAYDERILGSGGFVESVLRSAERDAAPNPLRECPFERLVERVAMYFKIPKKDLLHKGRRIIVCRAKAVLIHLATNYKGQSCKAMGELTGMSFQAASKARERGALLWDEDSELRKLIS